MKIIKKKVLVVKIPTKLVKLAKTEILQPLLTNSIP